MNSKSDVAVKSKYIEKLIKNGYTDVKVIKSPSDIVARKNGKEYFFEIKMTTRKDKYFGAATLTEWEAAIKFKNRYTFVIAKTDINQEVFRFHEFTPEEFMKYSTIPPFKFFFNIDLNNIENSKTKAKSKSVKLTESNLNDLILIYKKLKDS